MIGKKRPYSTYRAMSHGGELAGLASVKSSNFVRVSRAQFFKPSSLQNRNSTSSEDKQKKQFYSSADFVEDSYQLVGEGTYGKVYKATLKKEQTSKTAVANQQGAIQSMKSDRDEEQSMAAAPLDQDDGK